MASRDFKMELIDMIDRLLAGAWTVEEFRREYYEYVDWVKLRRVGFGG